MGSSQHQPSRFGASISPTKSVGFTFKALLKSCSATTRPKYTQYKYIYIYHIQYTYNIYIYIIEQHQKPPWRDLVFGFMWGTPRESQTFTRESRAKAPRKECVKVEPRKQWRKQVDSRSTFKYLETHVSKISGAFPTYKKIRRKSTRMAQCRKHGAIPQKRRNGNSARARTAQSRAKMVQSLAKTAHSNTKI